MGFQDPVHLQGGDLFAAAVDQLLEPSREGEVALPIQKPEVAGAKPAVREGRGVGLRVGLLSIDDVGTPDHDLPGRADGEKLAIVGHGGNLDSGALPDRAR